MEYAYPDELHEDYGEPLTGEKCPLSSISLFEIDDSPKQARDKRKANSKRRAFHAAACREIGTSGVFTRRWSNANVSVDCNTLTGRISMQDGRVLQSPSLATGAGGDSGAATSGGSAARIRYGGGYGGRGFRVPPTV
jgi:hypothetical protein